MRTPVACELIEVRRQNIAIACGLLGCLQQKLGQELLELYTAIVARVFANATYDAVAPTFG